MPRVPKLPPGIREGMRDAQGRIVVLTENRWRHIMKGHPALDGLELALKRTVETAEIRGRGRGDRVERLYGRNLGPARWLVVVVAYDLQNRGNILTAYPQSQDPKIEDQDA